MRPQHIATLTRGAGAMYTIAFQPSSDILAAGGEDKAVRLWTTDPGKAADYICSTAGDALTSAQSARYIPGYPFKQPCPTI